MSSLGAVTFFLAGYWANEVLRWYVRRYRERQQAAYVKARLAAEERDPT